MIVMIVKIVKIVKIVSINVFDESDGNGESEY